MGQHLLSHGQPYPDCPGVISGLPPLTCPSHPGCLPLQPVLQVAGNPGVWCSWDLQPQNRSCSLLPCFIPQDPAKDFALKPASAQVIDHLNFLSEVTWPWGMGDHPRHRDNSRDSDLLMPTPSSSSTAWGGADDAVIPRVRGTLIILRDKNPK